MPDHPAPHRPHDHESCGRCGFPVITYMPLPGAYAHATTAGAAACAIARHLDQLSADGWKLRAPLKEGHAPMNSTATAPDGVVHQLDGDKTRCGLDAAGWSRAITEPQIAGLVIFCEACQ